MLRLAIYWFVYPLLGGVLGMIWGLAEPPFHLVVKGVPLGYPEIALLSLGGIFLGTIVASIHTLLSYRRIYR